MNGSDIKQALAAALTVKISESDHATRGWHLELTVAPRQVTTAAEIFSRQGFFIEAVTGVDWLGEQAALAKAISKETPEAIASEPAPDSFEVVYDFNHYQKLYRVVIRTRVPRTAPELPTISAIYPGANWHEREAHDFFGIVFVGHPDLSPLLLPEDADFHPLRKDYSP